jgi:hypothetical protein
MAPLASDLCSLLQVDLTVYLPRQQVLQRMCSVPNLPIVAVYTVRLADGTFKGYIIVGIPPDGVSAWSSAIQTPFEGSPMPNEYAAVDSAADAVIQFLCTHKNVKVDDVNYGPRMQAEQMCAASATYHQALAEQAQRQTNTLWFRYEDLMGKIKYICLKSAGLLPINHERIRGPTGDLTIRPVYAGSRKPVIRRHKLANSLTRLLGHKRATERALLEQVKETCLQLYPTLQPNTCYN